MDSSVFRLHSPHINANITQKLRRQLLGFDNYLRGPKVDPRRQPNTIHTIRCHETKRKTQRGREGEGLLPLFSLSLFYRERWRERERGKRGFLFRQCFFLLLCLGLVWVNPLFFWFAWVFVESNLFSFDFCVSLSHTNTDRQIERQREKGREGRIVVY